MPGWKSAGVLALLCSGVAWASFPRAGYAPLDEQWQALAVAPLSGGGVTGMPMAPTEAVQPVDFVPHRALAAQEGAAAAKPTAMPAAPTRIRGRVGEGLYWSLRAAGASPQVAADYLAALATQIDVGEVGPSDAFDMVVGANGELLYAGLERVGSGPLQLVHWTENGRGAWVDAANIARPAPVEIGMAMPAKGPITSYFGYRYHPILHFTRFHAGVDIGAGWGSPIVAAGAGRVIAAGWAGGFGQEVEIAHGGGITSIYGHMSQVIAQPGSFVSAGQLIGYVGSSGLSTGPHLHFEVRQSGAPVNPLAVHFASAPKLDANLADAVKARLKALLAVGVRG
jgi:murein DD-endopeptidase MepM/ murein hydrolase activator NlpD